MCLTRDYKHIPQRTLIEDCALEHAIEFDKLNDCATKDDGAYGIGMLRESVQRTAKVHLSSALHRSLFSIINNPPRPASQKAARSG
jgi:hypothetical protein